MKHEGVLFLTTFCFWIFLVPLGYLLIHPLKKVSQMRVLFTPVFNRKHKLSKKGRAPIEIRIYQNRKRKFISTGISIKPNQWDAKNEVVNDKHPDYESLNYDIKSLITKFENQKTLQVIKGKSFSINQIQHKKGHKVTPSFIEFIRNEVADNAEIKPKTKTSHLNTVNKLLEYKSGADILIGDVDFSFVAGFINSLRKQKLAVNTVHKQYKNLKKYIELAINKGLYEGNNPCKSKELVVRPEVTKRDFITIDEIKKIADLNLTKFDERFTWVRDMFLFGCYTGLRISDVVNLKTEYIIKDVDGYKLQFKSIKVDKDVSLPLRDLFPVPKKKLSRPETILEKYYDKKHTHLFPDITEPFINRHLKGIGEEAKTPIKLTFHVSRHSFGNYMATKIPLPQLMYLMQHSDIKTTMMYVNTKANEVKKGLQKVDWD